MKKAVFIGTDTDHTKDIHDIKNKLFKKGLYDFNVVVNFTCEEIICYLRYILRLMKKRDTLYLYVYGSLAIDSNGKEYLYNNDSPIYPDEIKELINLVTCKKKILFNYCAS